MDVTLSQYRVYYKSLGLKMACAIVIVAVVPCSLWRPLVDTFSWDRTSRRYWIT